MQKILPLIGVISLWAGPVCAADPATNSPLPKCPPDWRVELVAEAPKVRYPTVVCCAPDGRVFVAEDYMDGKAGGGDQPTDRILCFHPDGKVTVFAEKLYAVFGLQYLDGKLYVHHSPKFSVFDDESGVGARRVDLIGCTNPKPWLPSFNDHVPAGFRLAMDGYFYLCTGDKGIYGAVGTDGRKLELHGGGIVRLRPDGSGLEIVCRGTRNHLDVAINSKDEMFTWDNTDDGQGWDTRLTHMVDGGFYGYPYDYKPRRPYTLWMMAAYGGGAPTGAIAYNEDALPAEYHGDLFMGDWSKRQVSRFRIARAGATFSVLTNEIFLASGDKDFRPVGLAFSPDGASLYIGDWNFHHWQEGRETGRLLKVTFTGASQALPKPPWFAAAAMGDARGVSTAQLLAGLRHPAQAVRLVAQRRLAERGKEAVKPLKSLLADKKAPSFARWHAVWTLDALDGGSSARRELLSHLTDADLSVRAQVIRQAGTRRVKDARKTLEKLLVHTNAVIRFHAATALGRIADRASVPALQAVLEEKDFFTRYAMFTALNLIGRAEPKAWPDIAKGLESTRPGVREGTLFALRESHYEPVVEALVAFLAKKTASEPTRKETLDLLAELSHTPAEWKGEWWQTTPAGSPRPVNTVIWPGTAKVTAALHSALRDPSPVLRRAALDNIRAQKDASASQALGEMFAREQEIELRKAILETVRETKAVLAGEALADAVFKDPAGNRDLLPEAIATAGAIGGARMIDLLIQTVRTPPTAELRNKALEALGAAKATNAVALIVPMLFHEDQSVRNSSADALKQIGGEPISITLQPLLTPAATDTARALAAVTRTNKVVTPELLLETQRRVLAILGAIKIRSVVELLIRVWENATLRDDAALALAAIPDERAMDIYVDGLDSTNSVVRNKSSDALRAIHVAVLPRLESLAKSAGFAPTVITELQRIYNNHEPARRGPLFASTPFQTSSRNHAEYALTNAGWAIRGQKIFSNRNGAACLSCHRVSGEGGEAGPDLTSIGAKYTRAQLIEEVMFPSRSVLDGYKQSLVTTKNGELHTGIIRQETTTEMTLIDAGGKIMKLSKAEIQFVRNSPLSLMPEGLHLGLSVQQFSDLITYLASLRGLPAAGK